MEPRPVIWASVYPESQDDLAAPCDNRSSALRLDGFVALVRGRVIGNVMGRGFRCGFLGMLHMEIITERLRREFDLGAYCHATDYSI